MNHSIDYKSLFDVSPMPYLILATDLTIIDANSAYLKATARRREDLIGHHIFDAFPSNPDDPDSAGMQLMQQSLERVIATGKPDRTALLRYPASLFREEGGVFEERYWSVVNTPIVERDGSVSSVFSYAHDISEQKRIENEMRINNERWNFVLEGSGDGFWDWDLGTNELVLSKRWKEMLGYEEHEIQNKPEEAEKRLHPEDKPYVIAQTAECLSGSREIFSCEYRMRCRDGSWKWVHGRGKVVSHDADGLPLRMTGTVTDISEKKRSEEQVWHQANFDALTGLPNRSLFRDRLNHQVKKAQRVGSQFALLFIDLDRFKEANDLLGHDVGDILLQQAATRIGASVRATDTVARLGGDEFTVILSDLSEIAHVEEVAQKILDALAKPFRLGQEVIYLSGSIGITLCPGDSTEPEDLLRNADQAMYVAKNSGKNQFSYFTQSMQESAHSRLRLIAELREALSAKQFRVFFQPIVDLAKSRIVKAEALLRWFHPTQGICYPSAFIPLAEETGLITEIGNWVFMQSALWSQRWGGQLGMPFQISVNKSPVQFYAEKKGSNWPQHLIDLGLSRNSISVEITESLLLNASTSVSKKLLEYRDAGIQVALDDFGTGYSSMSYLKKFDIDYLKIDQSFVQDMENNQGSRTIAETIIVMAHKLGLKVIAEGIETTEQRDLLALAGCDFGQGFLFSAAIPPEELEPLLHKEAVSI